MKAYVDQTMCIGCGLCSALAGDVFRMNAEGSAEAYGEGDSSQVQEAIHGCPVGAITEQSSEHV